MQKNKVVIVAGPTASGKSSYALELAKQSNGVIINADSMQVYKEIPIISASPSLQDKKEVEHKLYNFLSIKEDFSVAKWINLAYNETTKALNEEKDVYIVGGTGFYTNSLLNGISNIPEVDKSFYEELEQECLKHGLNALYSNLEAKDPSFAKTIKSNDKQRIIRALAVYNSSGKNLSYYHKQGNEKIFNYKAEVRLIARDRKELYKRSDKRFDQMLKQGALKEAEAIAKGNFNLTSGMKALGLEQLMLYLEGKKTLQEASEEAKKQTRNYIKRQTTWFKNKLNPNTIINL